MRVVAGSDTTITSPVFVTGDETASDCDSAPTVAVVDAAGTTLTAPTATKVATGTYQATLTAAAHTTHVDRLTVTWSGTVSSATQVLTQEVEVAGGVYVSVAELRNIGPLSDPGRFPSSLLIATRNEFEDIAEQYLGTAFVRRLATETHLGADRERLMLGHINARALRSITVNDTTGNVDDYTLNDAGWLWSPGGFCRSELVEVAYEHGLDAPPSPLVRGCIEYVRAMALLSRSDAPRNVTSESIDGSVSVRYWTPDAANRRATGQQIVDAALGQTPNYSIPAVG